MAGQQLETNISIGGKINPSLNKAFSQSQKQVDKLASKMKSVGKIMKGAAVAAGTAIVAGAGYSIKAAIDYETSLAKVGTIADQTKKSLSQISNETLALSSATGVAASEINEATYQAISAGVDTAKAVNVVETAVKASKGGFTDVTTAIDGLSTVLNTYGMEADNAELIANQMLVTQNKGKTSFGELAGTVGKLAPLMNSANIQTDEMFSSLASLTANGIQTSEAVSGIKAAVSNIIKPSTQASKVAKSLGLDFSATALESKGLAGFLQDVKEKTGGNLETMSKLFGSVEGLNSVLTLTSDNGMSLMLETMDEMKTNTTALQDAFETMTGTPSERIERLKNKIKNMAISIGEKLLPIAEKVIERLENVDFDDVIQKINDGIQWFIDNGSNLITIAIGIASAMAFWNVISMIKGIIGAVKAWQLATQGMTIAQRVLNLVMSMNPLGIVMTIIGTLIAVIGSLMAKGMSFGEAWSTLWGYVGDVVLGVWNAIKGVFDKIISFFTGKKKVDVDVDVKEKSSKTESAYKKGSKVAGKTVPAYAKGATVTTPHLALVGDYAETIVPHNNTPRSRALLQEAANGVGMALTSSNSNVSITYAPNIIGGSKVETKEALKENYNDFEEKMDNFFNKKRRLSFE